MGLVMGAAAAVDFLEAVDDDGQGAAVRHRATFGLRARQIAGGEGVSLRDEDGRLLIAAGLYPIGPQDLEVWFAAGPRLKGRMWEAMAQARFVLDAMCGELTPVTVTAYSRPGGVAAPVLARWFGFTAVDELASPIGPLTVWTRRWA